MLQKNKAVPQVEARLVVCGWEPFGLSFFGNNLESNLSSYILVKFHGSFVSANFLNILEDDALTIHFDTELSEFFGDVEVRNRTIDGTGGAHLGSDLDTLYCVDLFSQCDSVVLDLFELVSLLLERLCKILFCRSRSEESLTRGKEEIAAVAVFHGDDFVLETETLHVFFENEFHVYTSSFNYFIKSVT